MRLKPVQYLLIVLGVLSVTDAVFAWGPATHIGLGRCVLENLGLLPAAVAALLGRHAMAFLYGNIAADVVFAKRLSRVKQFCHHWSTAFALSANTHDDEERAFAYGYLAHLAADTVAHGKYVPRQIVVSGCSVNFGHLYWELRADALESAPSWRVLEQVLAANHTKHHHLLAMQLRGTFLPFELNRALFAGLNSLTTRQGFRRTMTTVDWFSRWPLSSTLLEGYRADCVDRIQSVLSHGEASSVLRDDPSGTSALMQVRVQRRGGGVLHRKRRRMQLREASFDLAPILTASTPVGGTRLMPVLNTARPVAAANQ